MDPNTNLDEQLALAREIQEIVDRQDPDNHDLRSEDWPRIAECAERMAELALALDEWRAKGGFDPYAPTEKVYVVVWTGDIETNGQAYRTEEAARRDYGDDIEDASGNTYLIESTVQG